jgi:hypothetical protein
VIAAAASAALHHRQAPLLPRQIAVPRSSRLALQRSGNVLGHVAVFLYNRQSPVYSLYSCPQKEQIRRPDKCQHKPQVLETYQKSLRLANADMIFTRLYVK